MTPLERVVAIGGGVLLVGWVLDAAIRTFMLPRASRVRLTAWIARLVRAVFDLLAPRRASYAWRDRVLAFQPPLTLLAFQVVWLSLVFAGFTAMFWGASDDIGWLEAVRESGSALFTLGFATPVSGTPLALVFAEAIIGLTLMALLISYLPTIYAAFQKREFMVAKLATRSGSPSTPWRGLIVAHVTGSMDWMDRTFWGEWENWFVDIAESHTSLTILNWYRSPEPQNHWIAAARSVLDMAALRVSVVDEPSPTVGAQLTIRNGTIALRALARHFRQPFDPAPRPDDPISLTREHFDVVCAEMAAAGVPLKEDRDAAWVAFSGWRVNYDSIVEAAAEALDAPPSPWSSLLTV